MEQNKENNIKELSFERKKEKEKDTLENNIKINKAKKEKHNKERLEKNKKVLRDYRIK